MSTQQHGGSWSDDDDDFDGVDDGATSNAMKELRRADRAKAKRIAELEAQLAQRSKEDRERAVKGVLQARSLNEKISALIPPDVEPTEEAVGKWIDEYGDVFGIPASAPDPEREATLGQLRQMDDVAAQLQTPAQGMDVAARLNSVQTKEELDALIFGGGAGR